MFYRTLTVILVSLVIGSLFFVKVNANDPATYNTIGHLNYAAHILANKERDLLTQWMSLDKLEIQQAMLRVQWDDNAEDMAENAISLGNAVSVDVLQIVTGIITSLANSIKDYADHVVLATARAEKNLEIGYQNLRTQQAVNFRDTAYTHYKAHYDAYVDEYSGSLDLITKGGTPSNLSADTGLSVPCANLKCSTTYSVSDHGLNMVVWYAYNNHKVTCPREHGYMSTTTSGTRQVDLPTPPPYWDCPDDPGKCPLSHRHKVPCRGGCGTQFPKKPASFIPEDTSHFKGICEGFNIPESYVKTFGSSNKLVDCPGGFYNC